MDWILNLLFPCPHSHLSFPITPTRRGKPVGPCYVACLRCGREWNYDWSTMTRGAELGKRPLEPESLPERMAGV